MALSTTIALAVGACSSSGVDARTAAVRDTGTVSLKTTCTATICAGSHGGAPIKIQVPSSKWNGTLIIWSHGYRPAAPVPDNPLTPTTLSPVDRSAPDAPTPEIASMLVSEGYAVAGSAFATNGWDVPDGVRANLKLYNYFSSTFGTPKRVYLWGESLGGLITETLAETHPSWVSGVAPLCGVLAGTNRNLDLALDVAYAVKTLVAPKLKLTGFASNAEALAQWHYATTALVAAAQKGNVADLFAIADIAGAPSPPRTDMFDGATITSQVEAVVQSIVVALGYGTYGRYDIEQRVGGNPSQNTRVDYSTRITPSPLIGDKLVAIDKALASGTRVAADPAARAKASLLGTPDGSIQRPTITLHTEADPLVLVQNENVFARLVGVHARGGQLVQLYTGPPTTYSTAPYGAGHCNFTSVELVGVMHMLDNWVRYNVYAGPGAVAQAFNYSVDNTAVGRNTPSKIAAGTATTGYDPNFAAPAWPSSPAG